MPLDLDRHAHESQLHLGLTASFLVESTGKGQEFHTPPSPAAHRTQPTSSAISSRALLLLSHRDRYMVVSFSSFLIFLVIWVM